MIGIQVGAVSFVDEGTERVLDTLAGDGRRSTRSSSRRSRMAAASPDGNCRISRCRITARSSTTRTRFTAATTRRRIRSTTATRPSGRRRRRIIGAYDVLADVVPAAHKRGMKVICWFEDVLRYTANIAAPGFEQAREVVLSGRSPTSRARAIPAHAQLLARPRRGLPALVRRRRPDVGQRAAGAARQRARHQSRRRRRRRPARLLLPVLPRRREDSAASTSIARRRATPARPRGPRRSRRGQKPADGAFVTFWRLLVKYPEILAWERLWNDALNDTYRDMYTLAHEIAPAQGHRLARVAQQLVLAVLPRRAGLRGRSASTPTS